MSHEHETTAGQIISDMQAAGVIPGPAPAPGRRRQIIMAGLMYGIGACWAIAVIMFARLIVIELMR